MATASAAAITKSKDGAAVLQPASSASTARKSQGVVIANLVSPPPASSASSPYVVYVAAVPDSLTTPDWTAKVNSIATPCIAIVAGVVTAYFAWRQWRTSKTAIRLGLLDKALAIQSAANELISVVAHPSGVGMEELANISKRLAGARWIFGEDVENYLSELMNEASQKKLGKPKLLKASMTQEQQIEALTSSAEAYTGRVSTERTKLYSLLKPYMDLRS